MSLLDELKSVLATDQPVIGRVDTLGNGRVTVATSSGLTTVSGQGLRVGDIVTVQAGRAVKRQRGSQPQVFYV